MRNYRLLLLLAFVWITASGCSQEDDKVNILFFSELPADAERDIRSVIPEEAETVQLAFYPFHHEKLMVELAGKTGDLFLVPQEEVANLIDPVAFTKLTDVAAEDSSVDAFKREDPDTGDVHVYAIPISAGTEKPLAAFIPNYSEDKEKALAILKALAN